MTPDEARASLRSLDLDPASVDVLFAHFADCEARGKLGHGFSRIPWLVEQPFDVRARAAKRSSTDGIDRWDGNGALGYLTLAAVCDDVLADSVAGSRLVIASPCFPTGRSRLLGEASRRRRLRRARHRHVAASAPVTRWRYPVDRNEPARDRDPLE